MIEVVDVNDSGVVRNKSNVLVLYDLMIDKKKSEEATAKFVSPAYIQHNPLIADGSVALGKFFGQITQGIAGVDIYKMDADGKAIEHWDILQLVGDPKNSAPLIAPNIPRANPNGMF